MGDWIQTFTGKQFRPLAPHLCTIDIEDIAHALSNLCRFTGHCRTFYSVAQHCVLVSRNVPPKAALWGLLHDATEAYLGDMARPVKKLLADYRMAEAILEQYVAEKFGISPEELEDPSVKEADLRALATERRDLMAPLDVEWDDIERVAPFVEHIRPMSPFEAKFAFFAEFHRIHEARRSEFDQWLAEKGGGR